MTTPTFAVSATPHRDALLTLTDGRHLGVASWGEHGGRPVVVCHGNPGSRLICPDLASTLAAGVQLIAVDRPGIGRSDPKLGFTLRDTADDLADVLRHLDLDTCTVVGWSSGAHQALALGAVHPALVEHVVLAGSPGPPDDPEVVAQRSETVGLIIEAVRAGSRNALTEVVARFQAVVDDPATILRSTLADDTDPDRRLMQDPEVARFLVAMWTEGVRQGPEGLAEMWAAQNARDWGWLPEQIDVPVTVWHGVDDRVCPVGQAERLAARIPGARMRRIEAAGHLVPIEHWAQMLVPA